MNTIKKEVFYYPLRTEEVNTAHNWAEKNKFNIEISHQNDGNIIYKFERKKV